ncbi:MAG: trypsin-like serine protease [Desulfobacterales bacterium]
MKKILAAMLSLPLVACGPADDKSGEVELNPPQNEARVINGTPGEHSMFPSIVALLDYAGGEMCTGTLIKEDLVITAAHCIPYIESAAYGVSDINTLSNGTGQDESPVYKIAVAVDHPDYYPFETYAPNDIGWALLEKPVRNAVLGDVLPEDLFDEALQVGNLVTIAGYGQNGETESGILYYGDVPITNLFTKKGPAEDYPDLPIKEMVVGKENIYEPNLCYGDSGGPTYLEHNGSVFVTGVTSRIPPNMPVSCGYGAVVTLPGAYSELTELKYEVMVKCRDTGDCDDIDIGSEEGQGGNGPGTPEKDPIRENHAEPFVMLDDTRCSYSGGRSGDDSSGLGFILGAVGLAYTIRRRRK